MEGLETSDIDFEHPCHPQVYQNQALFLHCNKDSCHHIQKTPNKKPQSNLGHLIQFDRMITLKTDFDLIFSRHATEVITASELQLEMQ